VGPNLRIVLDRRLRTPPEATLLIGGKGASVLRKRAKVDFARIVA
jgi:hypothetical protein